MDQREAKLRLREKAVEKREAEVWQPPCDSTISRVLMLFDYSVIAERLH